jgi:dihydrofolate reductase
MTRCSVFIATSLDGFIARENGAIDWLSMVERPDEDYGYARFFESIDTLVLGRKTYETAVGFEAWPYANKRVIVMTHEPPHRNSERSSSPAT